MIKRMRHTGFTIIELSIALVIIGLVLGGIFVGRDMTRSAAIRSQISQVDQLTAAVNTFIIKYDCLPGDCAEAVRYQFGTSGGPGDNGNGDGKLNTLTLHVLDNAPEITNFWRHLSKSGLIPNDYPGYTPGVPGLPGVHSPPLRYRSQGVRIGATSAKSPGIWVVPIGDLLAMTQNTSIASPHAWWITGHADWAGSGDTFHPRDAYSMDSKMDDGLPKNGKFFAFGYGAGFWEAGVSYSTDPQNQQHYVCLRDNVTPVEYNINSDFTANPFSQISFCSALIETTF